jgi:uncharacterized protein (TIGR00369 family)
MALRADLSIAALEERAKIGLPGLLGLRVLRLTEGEVVMRAQVQPKMLAPNGYLHAASVIALADTACGFACIAHLPPGAVNFTTLELKTNFLGTVTEGTIDAVARSAHLGRTTQVWDATVTAVESGKTLALFRCTQMVLWPKPGAS